MRLETHSLERRTGEFPWSRIARQAEHRAARVRIPIGRAKADKGGHEVNLLRRVGLSRHRPRLRRVLDQMQPVPKPLHRSTGNENRALKRVSSPPLQLVGNGGEQTIAGHQRLITRIQQREASRAIGRFQHARLEARLPHSRRLLITGNPAHRNRAAKQVRQSQAELRRRIAHLGQHRPRHADHLEERIIPRALMNIVKQSARCIRRIGGMHCAAGETPEQETVHGSKGELALFRPRPGTRHMVQNPRDFRARKIRIEQKPGLLRHKRLVPLSL